MSEHMFGIGHDAPTQTNATKIGRIARTHGFGFVQTTMPGTGYQHWFAGPNRGAPFDGDAERAIWADLEAAGLANAKGVIPRR